mmetsp:Transcript_45919/g.87655  ORF Transcript_45919/g.87655 Transcript_45919/m.87655 type:complete len:257 (-) Transcript_45919:1062-1832(-)
MCDLRGFLPTALLLRVPVLDTDPGPFDLEDFFSDHSSFALCCRRSMLSSNGSGLVLSLVAIATMASYTLMSTSKAMFASTSDSRCTAACCTCSPTGMALVTYSSILTCSLACAARQMDWMVRAAAFLRASSLRMRCSRPFHVDWMRTAARSSVSLCLCSFMRRQVNPRYIFWMEVAARFSTSTRLASRTRLPRYQDWSRSTASVRITSLMSSHGCRKTDKLSLKLYQKGRPVLVFTNSIQGYGTKLVSSKWKSAMG